MPQNIDDFIYEIIVDFHSKTSGVPVGGKNRRELSWNLCHEEFVKAKGNKLTDCDKHRLALLLSYYLFQFGMGRNSKLLTDYDYTVHIEALKIIFKKKYDNLWDCDYTNTANYKNLVFDPSDGVYIKLEKYYDNKGISPTDTLITKILLGTICCLPAYDNYLKEGLSYFGLIQRVLNKRGLNDLHGFYSDHKTGFDKACQKTGYPPYRAIDIFFNYFGFILDTLTSSNKTYTSKCSKGIKLKTNTTMPFSAQELLTDYYSVI